MNYYVNLVFSLSIVFSVIIGWARYRKTDPAFLPFLLLLTFAFANEVISIWLMEKGYSNFINVNVFELIESVLVTWQFLKWGLFERQKQFYFCCRLHLLFYGPVKILSAPSGLSILILLLCIRLPL